jgi:hypothetical protein
MGFEVPDNYLRVAIVSPQDEMGMIVSNAAGGALVLAFSARAGETGGDGAALIGVEPYRWILQRRLRGSTKSNVVRVVGVRATRGHLGRGTELEQFP